MFSNVLDNIDLRQIGKQLQQARKARGMTQADAAKVIDVKQSTLVAIEQGERRLKPSELIKLARAYEQDVADFVCPFSNDIALIQDQHLAIETLDQGLITEGQFSKLLGVDRLESRCIAESLRNDSSR